MPRATELPRWSRTALVLAAVLVLGGIRPTFSMGALDPPDELAAVDAYREAWPTAAGSSAVLETRLRARSALPPALSRMIEREGGMDAARLKGLVTSGEFVAPRTVPADAASPTPSEASAFGAALFGSTRQIRLVVAAIFLGTPTVIVFALLRRRRRDSLG